ncbi:hypothetical protein L1887_28742 [Cichorium endivia]|nr:hypothetical protein L1887_28742 [Cichorium endivia]
MALIYLKLATLVLVSLMVLTITDILTSFPNWHPTIRTVLQIYLSISPPFGFPNKYPPIFHTEKQAHTDTTCSDVVCCIPLIYILTGGGDHQNPKISD